MDNQYQFIFNTYIFYNLIWMSLEFSQDSRRENNRFTIQNKDIVHNPHNFIGALVREGQQTKQMLGSCLFLNENLAITSASNIYDRGYNGKYDHIMVYRAPHGLLNQVNSYSIEAIRFPEKYNDHAKGHRTQYNYALLKLKHMKVSSHQQKVLWPAIVPSCTQCAFDSNSKHQIALYGYVSQDISQDKKFSTQSKLFQKGAISQNQFLGIDLEPRYKVKYLIGPQAWQSSGCPIMIDRKLLGFHIGSSQQEQQHKIGRLFTIDLIEQLLCWCQQLSANFISIDIDMACQHVLGWICSESFEGKYRYHTLLSNQARLVKLTEENISLSKRNRQLKNNLHRVQNDYEVLRLQKTQLLACLQEVRHQYINLQLQQQRFQYINQDIQMLQSRLKQKQLQNSQLINRCIDSQNKIRILQNILSNKMNRSADLSFRIQQIDRQTERWTTIVVDSINRQNGYSQNIAYSLQNIQFNTIINIRVVQQHLQERIHTLEQENLQLHAKLRDKSNKASIYYNTLAQLSNQYKRLQNFFVYQMNQVQQKHRMKISQYKRRCDQFQNNCGQYFNNCLRSIQKIQELNNKLLKSQQTIDNLKRNKIQNEAKIVSLKQYLYMLKKNMPGLKDNSQADRQKSIEIVIVDENQQYFNNPQSLNIQQQRNMGKNEKKQKNNLQKYIQSKLGEIQDIKRFVREFIGFINEIARQIDLNSKDEDKLKEMNQYYKSKFIQSQISTQQIVIVPEGQQQNQQLKEETIP